MRAAAATAALLAVAGCGTEQVVLPELGPPAAASIRRLLPNTVLPGTTLVLEGAGFGGGAVYQLHLRGRVDNQGAEAEQVVGLSVVSGERATGIFNAGHFASLGEGTFQGKAWITARTAGGSMAGGEVPAKLRLRRVLTPTARAGGSKLVYLNSRVPVVGNDFLLGGLEGSSQAALKGCFMPDGVTGSCAAKGRPVDVKLPMKPELEGRRNRAYFEFSPRIGGLRTGTIKATLMVRNVHGGSKVTVSAPVQISGYLDESGVLGVSPASVSLGQYLQIDGVGFVGGKEGTTAVTFNGTLRDAGAKYGKSVTFDLVTAQLTGYRARYVLEEGLGLGKVIDLRGRTVSGSLLGTWTPTVYWQTGSFRGRTSPLINLEVGGVKQVVWLRFTDGWSASLRRFGLAAADLKVRARISHVLARDYKGINIEFRTSEPTDFKLYSRVDIGGKDPNGLGLMGYDNTPGKDMDNKRLYDWVGGVNAATQQDGYPGYGGVFLESLLGFSMDPPQGILRSPLRSPLFDQIFDAFRKERGGRELSAAEAASARALQSGAGCPATGGRGQMVECAIFVLGNVIGTTVAHELGHSLGLSDPAGPATQYHNPGDGPNRLMDEGAHRPFAERAEIQGQGPAVFCKDEFVYLQKILPLYPKPADPVAKRPGCS